MSAPVKTRAEFQQLADVRLAEAKILLDAGAWDGAYYLAGYAVEVALKACIIKVVMATDAFLEKAFSGDCYTHDITKLIGLAGLRPAWDAALAADPVLSSYWVFVKDWSEQKRYHRVSDSEANNLYIAVSDAASGVLPWIKTRW